MNVAARLALFGMILAAAFVGALLAADALVPEAAVQSWSRDAGESSGQDEEMGTGNEGHDGD